MPEHRIEVEMPPKLVLNKDVRIVVTSDDVRLGELAISKGSIDWRPAKHPADRPYRMSWERFDAVMRELGRKL
jgi:flagellar basal body P-ring protein FlgI